MSEIWKPTQQPELYHHGVKGMKWGKHIFGQGAIQAGPSGGGGGESDPELAELAEKYKKGLISAKEFLSAKSGIEARKKLKEAESYRREFDRHNFNVRDDSTPFGKMAKKERESSNRKINRLRKEYGNTPLGKMEWAVNKGADKVKSALRKRKQQKDADYRQFAAHVRETRKRDKKERDKTVEELKQSRRSIPHGRKRNVTEGGTGVQIREPAERRRR